MASGFAAMDVTAGRFITYGLVALGMMAWGLHTRRLPTPRQFVAALMLSLLGFTGYYLLLVLAIRDMGVAMPALIIGTIPVWVMLLGKPQGLRWSALVSVQDTQAYWQRQGYRPQPLSDATQRQRLDSYGPGAVYMGQPLVLP